MDILRDSMHARKLRRSMTYLVKLFSKPHCAFILGLCYLQGMALLLQRKDLTADGVYNAFTRVLTDDSIRAAAAKVSKRTRSRKRTPVQETAGFCQYSL